MSNSQGDRTLRERVASLEVVVDELMGNGQPGEIDKIKDSINKLRNALIVYVFIELLSHVFGGNINLEALLKMILK